MSMQIAGIGTAVPVHRISQNDAAEIAKQYSCETAAQERLLKTLYRRAGVESRSSVVLERSDGPLDERQSFYTAADPTTLGRMRKYEASAGALAAAACAEALQDAAVAPSRVTHLITVSCSGFYAPGFDISLIKQLPLPPSVARVHLGFMGCQGVFNALRVAQAFLEADPAAAVLLCALELCSLHHQYGWDAEKVVANALFADGSGAVVAINAPATKPHQYRLLASGSIVLENSEDAMTWRIGNQGFEMSLSPRVPGLICHHLRPWLEDWLASQNASLASVGSWAVHPGGPRILSAVSEAMSLDRAALAISQEVLANYGNMSSPTILFILDRFRTANTKRPLVALAFGPGLTVEAALLA
jgi:predicted naringenin-chalcone synthase